MAQLPLVLAIPRFKSNEERIDLFTNGTALQTWMTSGGIVLPTLAKFLADNQAQIDTIGAKSVRTDIAQTFTDPEKEQARDNIGLGTAALANVEDFLTESSVVSHNKIDDNYLSRQQAIATNIPVSVKTLEIEYYNPLFANPNTLVGRSRYKRISATDLTNYPLEAYFRTQDRFMPNESTDLVNGGYWVIAELNPIPQMFGALGDGVNNDTQALNAWSSFISSGSLMNGLGMTITPPSGRYLIRDTVIFRFGTNLVCPEGSARYGFAIVVDAANWNAASDVAVLIQAKTESFTSAKVSGLTIDCNGVSGVQGLRFEGAYQNSELSNIWIYDVAPNAIGLSVTLIDRVGTVSVCESLLMENIYSIPAGVVGTISQPSIQLDRCQECTLINVKGFGKLPGGSGTPGAAGIKFLNCRGITMLGGASAFAKYGIEIEASTRTSAGFALEGVTYEGITDTTLYVHGTSTNKVNYVNNRAPRLEAPFSTLGLYAEYSDFLTAETLFQNITLGEGIISAVTYGYGTVTKPATARHLHMSLPNAVTNKYVLDNITQLKMDNSPAIELAVNGRLNGSSVQARWALQWSASSSLDNGVRFLTPDGLIPIAMSDAGGIARVGFLGATAAQRQTFPAAATDATTTQALANSIRTALINFGLGQ